MNTTDVITGVCRWLDANEFGTYRADAPYRPADRAITARRLPATPDWAIAVATYGQDDGLVTPDREINIQLRFRTAHEAGITAVDDWADRVFDALHMRHRITMGGVRVQRVVRTLSAPLGADENGREERADSYTLLLRI